MSETEINELDCMEYGHDEGSDGTCINCGNILDKCLECGETTANANLLCNGCNYEQLERMDRENELLREQYAGLSF